MPEAVFRYFPGLSDTQKESFTRLKSLYDEWNSRINVISRKDMDEFYIHHVLHSLSIAKVISFAPGTRILDVGTGGGFPGIPLAILFPLCEFTLLDSIGKKINVVTAVIEAAGLGNAFPLRKRAEEEDGRFDFIVSRAVTQFGSFVGLTSRNISPVNRNTLRNGIFYLKGGDLSLELESFRERVKVWNISEFFGESYFETKKIVYLPF